MKRKPKNKKPSKRETVDFFIDNVCWIAGSILYAAAVTIFSVPNGIAQSGLTGLSIIVNHLIGTPVGATNFVLNIPLIILAWVFIGWKFVAKTLWVTTLVSAALDISSYLLADYAFTDDTLLAALFSGILSGVGLGLIIFRGATSGGTDIIAKLMRKKWPHISMGRVILVADAVIVISAAIVYKSLTSALYAIVVIYVSTRLIDYIIYGSGHGKVLMCVTNRPKEISEAITSELKRGVTILPVQGGYTGESKSMLMCVVRPGEVSKLNKLIRSYDSNPFIIISEAGEVLGEGFKPPET